MDAILDLSAFAAPQIVSQHLPATQFDLGLGEQIGRMLRARATWSEPVVYLQGYVSSAGNSASPQFIARTPPVSEALRSIQRLRTFKAWNADWDAEGAPAPDRDAIDTAVLLVGFLAPLSARTRVALDAFGKPLIMVTAGDVEAEITVVDRNTIEFAVLADDDDGEVDVEFNGKELPPRLKSSLAAAGIAAA